VARQRQPGNRRSRPADESFPSITPHDLRHTAASLAISAGVNVKAVQRMLGHAKASMTLDAYADLFDTDLDTVAVDVDAAIKAAAAQDDPASISGATAGGVRAETAAAESPACA
jgi:integrase